MIVQLVVLHTTSGKVVCWLMLFPYVLLERYQCL